MAELYTGARMVDPKNGKDELLDFLVEEGRIAKVGKSLKAAGAKTHDLSGKLVIPGVVDMHVHFREPGTGGETIKSGAAAALRGGVTSVAAMPNTDPAIDSVTNLRSVKALAELAGLARVHFISAMTRGRQGKEIVEVALLKREGAVAFSDDGAPVADSGVMRLGMLAAAQAGAPVINHCEEPSLSCGGVMHEGLVSVKKGLKGQPGLSESVMVGRDLLLAAETGAHYHVAHVSTAGSLEQVRWARSKGVKVSAEVAPHHFILSDEDIPGYDTNYKMNPPLRTKADVAAMIEGLKAGLIEVIASDHAPHPIDKKSLEFDKAPFGIMGVETILPLSIKYLVQKGHMSLSKVIACLTCNPARVLGLDAGHLGVGAQADFVVIDPEKPSTYDVQTSPSLSRNTPFQGEKFPITIQATFLGGKLLHGKI